MDDLVGVDTGNRDIRKARLLKIENPMAAVAAALVAVATGRLTQLEIPEQWLRNLSNWFPQLPDGPVILARHLMSRGEAGRAEAKAQLEAGAASLAQSVMAAILPHRSGMGAA